jgi:hypothetical protein
MKAAALTAPLTGEPAPADLPINGIWLTQGSVRLTRLETWTGDGKLYIDVDGGGTLALDTGAVLLLALRLVSELGRMPIGRLCRRALQEAPRVLALLALRMGIDLIIYGGPPPMPDHPPLMPVGVGPQRGRRLAAKRRRSLNQSETANEARLSLALGTAAAAASPLAAAARPRPVDRGAAADRPVCSSRSDGAVVIPAELAVETAPPRADPQP